MSAEQGQPRTILEGVDFDELYSKWQALKADNATLRAERDASRVEYAELVEDLHRAHEIVAEALGQNVNVDGQIAPGVTVMADLLASRQRQICELSARVRDTPAAAETPRSAEEPCT